MGWGGNQHRRPGNRFIDSVRVRDSEFVFKMGQQENCPPGEEQPGVGDRLEDGDRRAEESEELTAWQMPL